jgi:hypothetical protein
MTLISRRSVLVAGTLATAGLLCPTAAVADTVRRITVGSGQTYVVAGTTRVAELVVEDGGTITAPDGYSLTVTVDGVEAGARLTETGGTDTAIAAGTYRGNVVLTVAEANPVAYNDLTFPFRQALYVDATGVVRAKSVPAAVAGGTVTAAGTTGIALASTGEAFNGVYVTAGKYTVDGPRIAFDANGRCDFVGYGAAIVGTGTDTALVVRGADIRNRGAVRTAVIADGGSDVVVRDSTIRVANGVLPADYVPTVDTSYMESAPWMLSISGNVRATNLLGENTRATYLNCSVYSEGWGALSVDEGSDTHLTAINCAVGNTGDDGYGTYGIGDCTEELLGCRFDVATYATINRGAAVHYGDSSRDAVAALNDALDLGLTAAELAAIPVRHTVVTSRRFGMMWHGAGSVTVDGGTVITSNEATFLDKGQQVAIAVDGSRGARLDPGNGILMQVMENDDPGPVVVDGKTVNEGVYHEPTGEPDRIDGFDVTEAHDTDATATFTDIALKGDFYNAMRGALNLVLTFDRAGIEGVISASASHHAIDTITAAEYRQLGEVTNTVQPVINNGVLVTLADRTQWTVTGTSYLSRLVVGAGARVTAPAGRTVTMTVDGEDTALAPGGTYAGAIVLTVR